MKQDFLSNTIYDTNINSIIWLQQTKRLNSHWLRVIKSRLSLTKVSFYIQSYYDLILMRDLCDLHAIIDFKQIDNKLQNMMNFMYDCFSQYQISVSQT